MPCRQIRLTARPDRRFIRSTYRSNRFVLAELSAPHAHRPDGDERIRPPVNLAFVLDRSGSMAGEKLRLAKLAVEQSIARLQPDDRFAVVVYDDVIDVVFPSATATAEARRTALQRLGEVRARNTTNLGAGWLRGCEQVAAYLSAEGVNRCLLLTDGLANVGMTDRDELAGHAAALRTRGVSTSTFGVGTDFDEVLLQAMATAGGGNFYYIAEPAAIADLITSEVGEALDVVARDVLLEIATPDGVSVESLSPFPFTTRGGRTEVSLGSLVAEQVVQIVLRLNFPFGEIGRDTGAVISVTAAGEAQLIDGASVSLEWQYADPRTNDLQPRDVDVDRAVARVFAARARQEATGLNRGGEFGAARAALLSVSKRIRGYAGTDSEMRAIVAELERDAAEVAAPMAAASLKQMHFRGYATAKMRSADGKALRLSDLDRSNS
jgi:Ca-activated chloride channel family protein